MLVIQKKSCSPIWCMIQRLFIFLFNWKTEWTIRKIDILTKIYLKSKRGWPGHSGLTWRSSDVIPHPYCYSDSPHGANIRSDSDSIYIQNTIFLLHCYTVCEQRGLCGGDITQWFCLNGACISSEWVMPYYFQHGARCLFTDCIRGGNRSKGTESLFSDLRLTKQILFQKLLLLSRDQTYIHSDVISREQGAAIGCTVHHTTP